MDDYSTSSFLQAFTRFSCNVGYPKKLLVDAGSQLIKGCENMQMNFIDIKSKLHKDVGVEFEVCPVAAHNMHGKVERKIKEVKLSLERTLTTNRLSILQWETISDSIANNINNLPIGIRNIKADYEMLDLITPNRLLLGRNNERSPVEPLSVSQNFEKILQNNLNVFNIIWFESWLTSYVPKLMEHPKWFKTDKDIVKGDVVLFIKHDGIIKSSYQYGIIEEVIPSRDEKIRKIKIKFKNHNEKLFRYSIRSVRDVVIIHKIDELSLSEELYEALKLCSSKLKMKNNWSNKTSIFVFKVMLSLINRV